MAKSAENKLVIVMENESQDKKKKHATESAADLERVTGRNVSMLIVGGVVMPLVVK